MGRTVKPPLNESGVQSVEVLSDITNIPKSTTGNDNLETCREGKRETRCSGSGHKRIFDVNDSRH